ncbi:hypothetical protein [Streptosporangium canum]|uniref:hypothetical protein n=1 Tax=Streptosporangium canum TaxID=324952 RepID=UPI0037A0157E
MTYVDDLHEPGDDREPDAPEEDEPLDLDELAAALADAKNDPGELGPATAEVLAAVPDLIAELRQAREQLAYWRSLEMDQVYAVARGGNQRPDDCVALLYYDTAATAAMLGARGAATAYMRVRTLHPWAELTAEPPF